jgi:hypothetical protein
MIAFEELGVCPHDHELRHFLTLNPSISFIHTNTHTHTCYNINNFTFIMDKSGGGGGGGEGLKEVSI